MHLSDDCWSAETGTYIALTNTQKTPTSFSTPQRTRNFLRSHESPHVWQPLEDLQMTRASSMLCCMKT
jgi:hypothetical protein